MAAALLLTAARTPGGAGAFGLLRTGAPGSIPSELRLPGAAWPACAQGGLEQVPFACAAETWNSCLWRGAREGSDRSVVGTRGITHASGSGD